MDKYTVRLWLHFDQINALQCSTQLLCCTSLFHYGLPWYEPHRDKTNKMGCAPSEDSDQTGPYCKFDLMHSKLVHNWCTLLNWHISAWSLVWTQHKRQPFCLPIKNSSFSRIKNINKLIKALEQNVLSASTHGCLWFFWRCTDCYCTGT